MGERVSAALELMVGALELCGASNKAIGIASVSATSIGVLPERTPIQRFAKKAARRFQEYDDSWAARVSLPERSAAQERVRDLLRSGVRQEILGAALLGDANFQVTLLGRGQAVFDGFDDTGREYMTRLVEMVRQVVLEHLNNPDLLAEATRGALEEIQRAIDGLNASVELTALAGANAAQVSLLVEGALRKRPVQFILGDRPLLAADFVERDEAQQLSRAMQGEGVASLVALQGMPGAGKSQLAAAFAEDCANAGWAFLGWVAASSRARVESALAMFAEDVGLANPGSDRQSAIRTLLNWLAGGNGDRLLVFDDVQDAEDILGLIPRGPGMRVVITTTSRTPKLGAVIEVEVYTAAQACDYLASATGLRDPEGALRLAEDLGRLPVALTQAATAIRLFGYAFGEFRRQLAQRALDDAVRIDSGHDYGAKVGAALRLAREAVLSRLLSQKADIAARAEHLMGAAALLAASGVPRYWFSALEDGDVSREAIGELLRASLLTSSTDGAVVSAHPLVRKVVLEDLDRSDRQAVVRTCIDILEAGARGISGDYVAQRQGNFLLGQQLAEVRGQMASGWLHVEPEWTALGLTTLARSVELHDPFTAVALADYVGDRAAQFGADDPETLSNRNNLAIAYQRAGRLDLAVALLQNTVADMERVLGKEHVETLVSCNNLANVYESSGDLSRAIALYEATLAAREALLGFDHPDTLISRNNLASAFESSGALHLAIALHEKTLLQQERVLGPNHSSTLTSRNNLACAYLSTGDLSRAISLFETTHTMREEVMGTDHPDTLSSASNLAIAYQRAGNLNRAIPLFTETQARRESILGPDHPDTLSSANNLAMAYHTAGNLNRAIPLLTETLTRRESILGPDHPDTLTSRSNLGGAYQSVGEVGQAIRLFSETLNDRVRVLGEDHPDTLGSRDNLAGALTAAGDLGRAILTYERAVADRERVLGTDHPSTLNSRNSLASACESAGNFDRAILMYERTLADREKVLGDDHPDTLVSRDNLAHACQSAGLIDRAIDLYETCQAAIDRLLGADHLDALTVRSNLAFAIQMTGDLDRAIPLYETTAAALERAAGADHPTTLSCRNNLASAYQSAGCLDRAIPLLEEVLATRETVLGTDHPKTLSSRNNLACAYQLAGHQDRAVALHEETLADRERVLGAFHPQTLTSRNNLGYAYESMGNLALALTLYRGALDDMERVLGPDHPETLISRNNLARATSIVEP